MHFRVAQVTKKSLLDIDILQGRVATRIRYGGIFNKHFIANFPDNLSVKKMWKSVKVWRSYCHEFRVSFYRAMPCIRGTSHGPVSVSVSVSVTSRCSTKTAKRRITQTTPHDSPGTLVFWRHRSPRNSTGVTPYGAPNAGGVGQNRRLSTNNRIYLENGKR